MMLSLRDLLPLAQYRRLRPHVRRAMTVHRSQLAINLGPHMRVQFEDLRSVWYQVQETLHLESVRDTDGMWEVLDTYAHLMPEPGQCKATVYVTSHHQPLQSNDRSHCSLTVLNAAVRQMELVGPACLQPIPAIANEDMADQHLHRLRGVHFLRFRLDNERRFLGLASSIMLRCTHPAYLYDALVPSAATHAQPTMKVSVHR